MSCTAPPKLLNYYSDKVCIYTSDCFIPLPTWRACPAPPCAEMIVPSVMGCPDKCGKPTVYPMPQPLNTAASYCAWAFNNYTNKCSPGKSCCSSCAGK